MRPCDACFLQAFRKAIGVRIKEETEIIEGEVGAHTLLLLGFLSCAEHQCSCTAAALLSLFLSGRQQQ